MAYAAVSVGMGVIIREQCSPSTLLCEKSSHIIFLNKKRGLAETNPLFKRVF
ncbi:hypothetical protein VCHA31O73_360037 [Vibrio chagasii]|nr:hypothetical protein VCHA31O73_360037 [Vibrio chagasii]